jgi:hypothetical protein
LELETLVIPRVDRNNAKYNFDLLMSRQIRILSAEPIILAQSVVPSEYCSRGTAPVAFCVTAVNGRFPSGRRQQISAIILEVVRFPQVCGITTELGDVIGGFIVDVVVVQRNVTADISRDGIVDCRVYSKLDDTVIRRRASERKRSRDNCDEYYCAQK